MRAAKLALLAALALLSACTQTKYLAQSVGGHLSLMAAAQPVDKLLAEPELDASLRERLLLSQRLRAYSVAELKLPDNDSYRRYADLRRSAAVWNVVATGELDLNLKTWCFPVMGCVGYRGYFKRADADAYADELRGQGQEVLVYGVPAYSTLGWSNFFGGDPLLNTFIKYPPGELAGMLFHELAHQVAYAADDTQFNESFASLVEQRGAEAWLQAQASPAERAAYAQRLQRREQFRALSSDYRRRLAELYGTEQSDASKRADKVALLHSLREDYTRLKTQDWAGDSSYDGWFARANNASFALLSAYADLTPAFDALLARQNHDWPRFYAEVKRLAALPKAQRRAELLHATGD